MPAFNVRLTYSAHANVNIIGAKGDAWRKAVSHAIDRYAKWGLPLTAQYTVVGDEHWVNVAIDGTISDPQLSSSDPQ